MRSCSSTCRTQLLPLSSLFFFASRRRHTRWPRLEFRRVLFRSILTVDMVALLPAAVNPRSWADVPGRARMTNLTPAELAAAGTAGTAIDPSVTFDIIRWLQQLSSLPVVVKGILRADDARRCVDAGAAGIVVSNHGGRRLGPSITPARALPEIVAAVGDSVELYADR